MGIWNRQWEKVDRNTSQDHVSSQRNKPDTVIGTSYLYMSTLCINIFTKYFQFFLLSHPLSNIRYMNMVNCIAEHWSYWLWQGNQDWNKLHLFYGKRVGFFLMFFLEACDVFFAWTWNNCIRLLGRKLDVAFLWRLSAADRDVCGRKVNTW